ncbi:MAG TPA: hypothetical protein VFV33_11600 [Gemmatimonadaceae bacterium]|nr:hypothetical protein [Gemmatimonadaceae bacterium]
MSTNSLSNHMIGKPFLRFVAAVAAATGLTACNDTLGLRASLAVAFDTASVYALTSSPVSYPAAFSFAGGIPVRVDPSIGFEVAFDLPGNGKVQLIPARRISATRVVNGFPSASPRVGMQAVKGTFESMTKAPTGGYAYDSTFAVAPGEAVVLELSSDACTYSLVSQQYAKLVVDSVNTGRRQIYIRAVRDPNCGFRSLQPGVPKS